MNIIELENRLVVAQAKFQIQADYLKSLLKNERERIGLNCGCCGSTGHYWSAKKEQWQCKSCRCSKTLYSGTFLEGSRISIEYWYKAFQYAFEYKLDYSVRELQMQLGIARYRTVWLMNQKLRNMIYQSQMLNPILKQTISEERFPTAFVEMLLSSKKETVGE